MSPVTRSSSILLVLLMGVVGCESAGAAVPEVAVVREIATPATATVTDISAPRTLELHGTLLPDQESRVMPIVPGSVVEVLVDRGSRVEAGQPLLRLRATDYQLQSAAARAALGQARARLGVGPRDAVPAPGDTAEVQAARAQMELAQQSLTRVEALAEQGVVPAQQLDQARAAATSAREQHRAVLNGATAALSAVAAARTSVRRASSAVADSVIRAPFSGEVVVTHVAVGEYVAPPMPLVTLVSIDPLRLELRVPQAQIADVHEGQRVVLSVDTYPGETFEGTIRFISAALDRQSRGLTIEALVPNEDGRLRPGLFVDAAVQLGEQLSFRQLPVSAVLDLAGVSRAFVIGEQVEERLLSVVERTPEWVWVDDGLAAGEEVATERLDALSDGMTLIGGHPDGSTPNAPQAQE